MQVMLLMSLHCTVPLDVTLILCNILFYRVVVATTKLASCLAIYTQLCQQGNYIQYFTDISQLVIYVQI